MTSATQLMLPHIDEVEHGPELESAVDQIGDFFAENGLIGLFGVRKLHRHFDVDDDEALLSRLDAAEQIIRTSVVARSRVGAHQACQWGFFPDGGLVVLGWSADVSNSPEIEAALPKIGKFLSERGLTGLLAVELRDWGLRAGPGAVLLENTDEGARTQSTRVIPSAEMPGRPASWNFSETGRPIVALGCGYSGNTH